MRWIEPRADRAAVARLASALALGPLTARILCSRGMTEPASAQRFLAPSLADLHDPFRLYGMSAAVARLRRAIESRERILIYGDYDVDGTTSIVILKKAIEMAGGAAEYHIPHRLKDGYGMRPEVVERAAGEGVTLLVSVDTGIRASETVRRAAELGIDSIVTDHHLPEAELPPALAVLNPNQPDCEYPEKNLCGVGVAFKLVQALLSGLGWPAVKLERTLESFLKLVAIGTVADVVSLTGENRVIVKHGLAGLDHVKNPGLRALLDVAGLTEGTTPSAGQIAFRVAPRINAAGRMATANAVIELFLTGDPARARTLAQELHALNTERQEAERRIVELCKETPVAESEAALVFAGENWHRGVLGIVASRVVEMHYRPTFVLGINPEDGTATGSGRSIRAFHLLQALEAMPDLFVKFGGHEHAAGLTLEASRVDEFRRRFHEYAAAHLTPEDLLPELRIDADLALPELNDQTADEVLDLAPFGYGNPQPVLLARDVEVAGPPAPLGERHLRVPVKQNGRTVWLKAWGFAERAGEVAAGRRVDVAFVVEEDSYSAKRGYAPWAAVLKDVRATR